MSQYWDPDEPPRVYFLSRNSDGNLVVTPPYLLTNNTPPYPVTNNNGYSSGQYLSRSSSSSTVVPGYNNPVDRSLSTNTTKQ
jgi:hypothetical protein